MYQLEFQKSLEDVLKCSIVLKEVIEFLGKEILLND